MTETITEKLATAASRDGITPGRRTSSRSGAAGGRGLLASGRPAASSSAMRCGSRQQRDAAGRPHAHEAEEHGDGDLETGAERRDDSAGRPDREAGGENGL